MEETVSVILSSNDAKLFMLFQKHRDLFEVLDREKVFEMKFGKCILNIAFGELQNVVKETMVYKK